MLCEADNVDTGAMWECPLLVELNTTAVGRKRGSSGNLQGINTIRDSHTQLSNGTGAAATKVGLSVPWMSMMHLPCVFDTSKVTATQAQKRVHGRCTMLWLFLEI